MYENNEHEEMSRQSLIGQAIRINRAGRFSFRASRAAESSTAARQAYYDTHGAVGRVTLMKIVEYLTFAIGLLCIYVIDVLLFGVSAQYVAALLGGENDLWAYLAKYAVPASFLGIEVLIAMKIEKARHEERFAFGSAGAKTGWIALGVLVALVMPLAAKATAQSVGVVADGDVPVLMVAVLGIISFTAHVLVLFGGRLAHEAKTYLAFALARGFHETRTAAAQRRAADALSELNAMFIGYVHAWRAHNARYEPLPSGPFDGGVVELLKRQFPQVASGGGGRLMRDSEE